MSRLVDQAVSTLGAAADLADAERSSCSAKVSNQPEATE
jgi:hypothetical protein